MPGLPLFKIPRVARNEILKHVDTFDLISLSFCSEKARVDVETANVPLKRVEFHFSNLNDLKIFVNQTFKIRLVSRGRLTGTRSEMICSEERRAGMEPVWKVEFLENTRDFASLRELLIGHFMETFRRIEAINVYNNYCTIQDIPVWKYTKSFEDLSSWFSRREVIPKEDVEFLLDELTVQHLKLGALVVDGFRYSRGFQQKSVNIEKATFVDFDAILNSQSEQIHLHSIERPTTAQLNTLLKLWMSMEKMQNLCYLKLAVSTHTPFPIEYLGEVLNGIVLESRSQQSAVIRRMDGKVAQITTTSNFNFALVLHSRN